MGNYISLRIAGSDISSTTLVSTVALVSPSCGVVESESFIDSAATAGPRRKISPAEQQDTMDRDKPAASLPSNGWINAEKR